MLLIFAVIQYVIQYCMYILLYTVKNVSADKTVRHSWSVQKLNNISLKSAECVCNFWYKELLRVPEGLCY